MVYLVVKISTQTKDNTQIRSRSGAFTLIDVLVSIAVISLLIGLMLPSIAMVRESARKVICSSGMRQIGLGMNLYAEDNKDMLPSSVFLDDDGGRTARAMFPQLMDTIRTDPGQYEDRVWGQWDGLGLLFYKGYISASGVYYCPSHNGTNGLEVYEDQWNFDSTTEIIANYQYRGIGPNGERHLYSMNSTSALVTDSLRSFDDINHDNGLNVLAAGLSVNWYDDIDSQIMESVMARTDDSIVDDANQAWQLFDGGSTSTP